MKNEGIRRHEHRNPADYRHVTESGILSDIAYFRAQLSDLPIDTDRYTRARRHVYLTLLQQRRQLLAATRAGRPQDWPSFPAE